MGLKKSYFKGLQNGVNSSPIRQNGIGVDKKLPILQPLTLEQLLGEKNNVNNNNSVVNDERANMSVSTDNLNINNISKPSNVSSNQLKFNLKEAIAKRKFEIENKTRPTISQGASTTKEVYSPQLKKMVTEKEQQQYITDEMNNASLDLLERPLSYLADPTAILGDLGVESVLGFETGNTDELAREIKANELNPNLSAFEKIKAKTGMGLEMVPAAAVNTGLGMIGAGGVGTGVKGMLGYGGNVVNNALNPLAGLGKPSAKVFNNIFKSGGDDAANIVTKFGSENASTWNKLKGRFDPKVKEDMSNVLTDLSKGAEMSRANRLQLAEDLNSAEGKKRLFNQEFSYLEDQLNATSNYVDNVPKSQFHPFIRNQDPSNPNLMVNGKKLYREDLEEQALKNVDLRIKEVTTPNLNEKAAEALEGGKLNYGKGYRVLHDVPETYLTSNATFGGQIDGGTSFALESGLGRAVFGPQQSSQFNPGKFVLGGKGSATPTTWQHEVGHGIQSGRTLPLDKELISNVKPNAAIQKYEKTLEKLRADRDKFVGLGEKDGFGIKGYNKANEALEQYEKTAGKFIGDELGSYNYFKSGGIGTKEPSAFGSELRQSLVERNFISNRYDEITPDILKQAKKSFDLNPSINTVDVGGGKKASISSTRIFDFMEGSLNNFTELSKSLNKLPAIATPVVGGGAMLAGGNEEKDVIN